MFKALCCMHNMGQRCTPCCVHFSARSQDLSTGILHLCCVDSEVYPCGMSDIIRLLPVSIKLLRTICLASADLLHMHLALAGALSNHQQYHVKGSRMHDAGA